MNTAAIASFDTHLTNIQNNILTPIIYLLFALAILYFMWGVMIFIRNADSPEKREEGFQHMIWGLVGLFIMLSVKGIIGIILATLGL